LSLLAGREADAGLAGAGGRGGRAATVVAGVVLVLSTVAFFRVALLPAIGADLALRPGLISLVTVAFGVGRLFADVPAGLLADRVAPLRALAGSAVGLGAGSLLLAGAHTLALLLAASAVLGVASSVTNTTGMTFFSRGPVAGRGTSLAVFSAALLGGQALGPGVSGVVSASAGWRLAEIAAGAAAALAAVACLAVVPRPGENGEPAPEGTAGPPLRPPGGQLALLYAASFAVFFALGAMPQTLLPLIGRRDYGLSAGAVGLLLGFGGLCRFAGAWIGGVVSDRRSRKAALVPSLLAMAAGALLLVVPGGPVVWVSSVALLSLASFGVTVAATMLADHGGGVRVGRRLGVFRFVGDLGLIAGPLSGGWLYDAYGTDAAAAAVAVVLAACALAAAAALRETRHLEMPVMLEAVG
jgi:DHA1 family multidrug resistance protein-like MFS transporter